MPSEPAFKRYLALLCLSAAMVLASLIAFNLAMDPYYVWRWSWPGINRDKPWIRSTETIGLEAALRRPATVFVGPSHVALGFDPNSSAFRAWDRPHIYSGVGPDFEFENQAVDAMSAGGGLHQALVELDARQFEPCNGTRANVPSVLDGLEHVLLLRAVGPSAAVLQRNIGRSRPGDQYIRQDAGPIRRLVPATPADIEDGLRATRQFLLARPSCDAPDPTRGFERLDRLVALARARHFTLTFFIAPFRPEMLLLIAQSGEWNRLEALKQRLAAYSTHTGVTIWDFSTSELEREDGAAEFADFVHFTPAVGDRMLSRMKAGPAAPGSFGRLLDQATLAQHLLEDRGTIAARLSAQAERNDRTGGSRLDQGPKTSR